MPKTKARAGQKDLRLKTPGTAPASELISSMRELQFFLREMLTYGLIQETPPQSLQNTIYSIAQQTSYHSLHYVNSQSIYKKTNPSRVNLFRNCIQSAQMPSSTKWTYPPYTE